MNKLASQNTTTNVSQRSESKNDVITRNMIGLQDTPERVMEQYYYKHEDQDNAPLFSFELRRRRGRGRGRGRKQGGGGEATIDLNRSQVFSKVDIKLQPSTSGERKGNSSVTAAAAAADDDADGDGDVGFFAKSVDLAELSSEIRAITQQEEYANDYIFSKNFWIDTDRLNCGLKLYRACYHFMRNTVAGILIQRVFDRASFVFDIATDIIVLVEFYALGHIFWTSFVFLTLLAPYLVCWSAGFRVVIDREGTPDWFKLLYLIPFTGIPILIGLDLLMILEAFLLNPLFLICGFYIREPSREEYGYLRLRSMAELFLESIPQAVLQLYIFAWRDGRALGLSRQTVILAFVSAVFNIVIMCVYIQRESVANKISFINWTIVSFQGRFGFTPFVSSIANGKVKIVDYTVNDTGALYFTAESLRKLVAAIQSEKCALQFLKMGTSCRAIHMKEEQLLWQLYDICAKKYIHLDEDKTGERVEFEGEKVMRLACIQNYGGILRKLLHRQPPCAPDATDKDGLSPLMLACKFNNYTLVRQLLSKMDALRCGRKLPNVNLVDNEGKTALMHSCDQEIIDEDLVRLVLTQTNNKPNIQNKEGRTALILAAMRGRRYGASAVRMMLAYGVPEIDVNMVDLFGMTALHHACRRGHLSVVKLLCRHRVIYESENGSQDIQYVIDTNTCDLLGRTPFAYACLEGRVDIVKYLVRLPAIRAVDLNKKSLKLDKHTTPLMFACKWDHVNVITALTQIQSIRAELDVNATDLMGRTALHHCCRNDRVDALRALLTADVRVDCTIVDKTGKKAYDYASIYCKAVMACFFEDLVTLTDKERETPVFMVEHIRFYCFMNKARQSEYIHLNPTHNILILRLLKVYAFNVEYIKQLYDEFGSLSLIYKRSQHVPMDKDNVLGYEGPDAKDFFEQFKITMRDDDGDDNKDNEEEEEEEEKETKGENEKKEKKIEIVSDTKPVDHANQTSSVTAIKKKNTLGQVETVDEKEKEKDKESEKKRLSAMGTGTIEPKKRKSTQIYAPDYDKDEGWIQDAANMDATGVTRTMVVDLEPSSSEDADKNEDKSSSSGPQMFPDS